MQMLLEHWTWLQYAALLVVGGLLIVLERRWPRRPTSSGVARWGVNLGLYGLGLLALWLVFEPLELAAIRLGLRLHWSGLAGLPLPGWATVALGVLVVDLLQYLVHRASHAIPLLWRLHQVHHADTELDVTTSVRHHPLEVMVIAVLVLMACAALRVPLESLLIYAAVQLAHTLFCHANLALSQALDRRLRWCIVTPDMHRVHHSVNEHEGHSNFSMVFSWWDRWGRSYCAQPAAAHASMALGLFTPAASGHALGASLALPFGRQ